MFKPVFTFIIFLYFSSLNSQTNKVDIPEYLNFNINSSIKEKVFSALEILFFQVCEEDTIDERLISKKHNSLTLSTLEFLKQHISKESTNKDSKQYLQLINAFEIEKDKYSLVISSISLVKNNPKLLFITNLIANYENEEITFTIPLEHLTNYWRTEKIGNITYYYRSKIDANRAMVFNEKNNLIAKNLGLKSDQLDFYMCKEKQEILTLLGLDYSILDNGVTRTGYGIDGKSIFAIDNNEDFSHDVFHYYSGKVNKRENRNWIAEEGIAYLWGNAYYTDSEGRMITHSDLVSELKDYLKTNPNTSLWTLFVEDTKIFSGIAPEISVRSTISGVLAKEIETKKGLNALISLINSGRKNRLENYMKTIESILGISKKNFDRQVLKLVQKG